MATKKTDLTKSWTPQKVHDLRVLYDKEVKGGKDPKSTTETFKFEGHEFVMGYAHYLLEYLETCVFWPPQSRLYARG